MNDDYSILKAKYDRLRLLHDVSRTIHSTLEPGRAFALIVEQAVRVAGASSGSVALINPTNGMLEIEAAHGLPAHAAAVALPVGRGVTGWVAKSGLPARVGDVRNDPRYVEIRPEVRSELAVPLEVAGETKGVLNVDADRVDAFSPEDEELLVALASEAARVIQHAWLYEQLRLKARLFESLAHVSQTINSASNLDEVLQLITRQACQLMETKMGAILLLDPGQEWLELRASHGAGPAYRERPPLNVHESLIGSVVRRRKPLQVEDVGASIRYQSMEVARREGLVSLLGVPLVHADRCIGALVVYSGVRHLFSNEEIRILGALADLSALAIQKATLYERLVEIEGQLRQGEKLSALGLLAAEIAHEIRNPLTVMKMLFHSMQLDFAKGDPRAKDAEVIRLKMEHLNRTVDKVLNLARTSEPEMKPVQVNPLLEDIGLLIRPKLRQEGIELVWELASGLPDTNGDSILLEQAFLNLALNAVEAMPGGGRLTIRTKAIEPAESAESSPGIIIELADTGHGIAPERRERLFTSLLNTTKPRGTGLGLAIVARVVETHGGKIEVESEPNRGTIFRIMLYAQRPDLGKE